MVHHKCALLFFHEYAAVICVCLVPDVLRQQLIMQSAPGPRLGQISRPIVQLKEGSQTQLSSAEQHFYEITMFRK